VTTLTGEAQVGRQRSPSRGWRSSGPR
jgi:hypothetical protein